MANQLKIKVESEHVLTESVLNGMDPSNILAQGVSEYTASQDCITVIKAASCLFQNTLRFGTNQASPVVEHYVLLKSGQKVKVESGYGCNIEHVFGIKR